MRRLLLASVLCCPAPAARAATTLAGPFDDSGASYTTVTNGGLESGTGNDASTWNEWVATTFGRSTTWRYAGSAGAAINDLTWTGAGGGKAITQTVTVTGGGSYVLSGYVYHPGTSGNAYLDLNDQSYTQLDGGTGDCSAVADRGWPEWQFVYCPFTVGSTTTSVTVRMVVDATWTGSPAAFDQIAITPLGSFVAPVSLDIDEDGYTAAEGDCDDAAASVHPGAADAWYDGVDSDCDGADDHDQDGDGLSRIGAPTGSADDCDDTDAGVGVASIWYADDDDDGHGSSAATTACVAPADHVAATGDCDDADADVHPGAAEVCDGADQDCDGTADDGIPTTRWYEDADADGFGDGAFVDACAAPSGWVDVAGDCADDDAAVNPDAAEVCDGADQDCDGTADDGIPTTRWYADTDADGFGDDAVHVDACGRPSGWVDVGGDCADEDAGVNPDAAEICDGLDQDCDGAADDGLAFDAWYEDADGDGYGDAATEVVACAAPDGAVADATDCDDGEALVHPGADELCNERDDDCDDLADEDVTDLDWYADADGDGFGDPEDAVVACDEPDGRVLDASDCDDGDPDVNPDAGEVFGDGIDQDCDGADATFDSSRSWVPDPGDTGDDPPPGSGCGCATGRRAPVWAVLAALALVRRRRAS